VLGIPVTRGQCQNVGAGHGELSGRRRRGSKQRLTHKFHLMTCISNNGWMATTVCILLLVYKKSLGAFAYLDSDGFRSRNLLNCATGKRDSKKHLLLSVAICDRITRTEFRDRM